MMRWALRALTVVAACLAAVQMAGAAGRTISSSRSHTLRLTIPLPSPGHASITKVTMEVTAPGGEVGAPSVHDADAAKLPPGVRAVALFTPKRSSAHHATFTEYVVINNLDTTTASAAFADDLVVDQEFRSDAFSFVEERTVVSKVKCPFAVILGNNVDEDYDSKTGEFKHYVIFRLRGKIEQPSDSESVLDFTIANRCPTAAEQPGPGDKPPV